MATELSANALLTGSTVLRGKSAVAKSAAAVKQVYDSIKTSYGPLGLDKMCIDASGSVLITNDGATILANIVLEEPSAKLLVNLALEQDKAVGDGTTSVVLLAANLILAGAKLVEEGVHPSTVVAGYTMAFNECVDYIKKHIAFKGDNSSIADAVVKTTLASKIINSDLSHFLEIVKKSLTNVFSDGKYFVDKVKIMKSLGGSLCESEFHDGFILNCAVASKATPKRIESPRILCLDFSLQKDKLPLSVNIQVTDPEKIEAIRAKEIELTREKCRAIICSGANLVLTTGGIDEMCVKMFADNGIVCVRRCLRDDLVILAKATGTDLKTSIVNVNNEYAVDGLGSCGLFELKEVGDFEPIFLTGCPTKLSSILLRGPNSQVLDETERSLNDALQAMKRTLESKSVVPGGGAVEAALSLMLEEFASEVNCREHVAIHRFSEALLELPRILATNAGLEPHKAVGDLLSKQHKLFSSGSRGVFLGLDVVSGEIQDNLKMGIVEPTMSKLKVLRAATEAAISVLRINEIVDFAEIK